MKKYRLCWAGLALFAPGLAAAQVPEIVITGSVVERRIEEAPYAIGLVGADALRSAGPLVNLSESMARVPGLTVANRWNYAQDLQISSRGFGARATFGVRGIRLYSDGIPAGGPDGQGQVSHFDLAGADRVEVLRGPFSALYGNSSGGVIAITSAPARERRVEGALDLGSFGLRQLRAQYAGPGTPGFDVRFGAAAFRIDGFRPRSEARRDLLNGRVGYQSASNQVTVVANVLDQPADDPLGLDRQQFDADPYQTTPQATQFDTRKTTRQAQLGASWKHRYEAGALRDAQLAVYAGRRGITQWLAIAAQTQTNARHGGGVVDFDRQYAGVEARLRFAWEGLDLVAGLAADRQRDARRGFENYTGPTSAPVYGGIGRLRRDEINRARSDDAFVQADAALGAGWFASGGVRAGRVRLSARDRFLANGDDSGERSFDYANPVAGLRWQAAPGLNLHASAARGFESPTLGELAYRADGSGGFNDRLLPQESTQFELGAKWRAGALQVDAALFEIRVDDEIAVATNAGGRSAFQNVGRTERRGAELAAAWRITPTWNARIAATWLDATYRDPFLVCAGIPCTAPTVPVPAGNRIAGTQRGSGYAELAWNTGVAGEWAIEARGAAKTAVNDRNSDAAPGYGVVGLRWSHKLPLGSAGRFEWLARIDNLADRRYAGSVIVNEANGRFFEPGAPRSVLVGLRWVDGP